MKRTQWTAFCCSLFLVFFWAMPAVAFEIGARAYYWFPTLKTNIKADGAGLVGTDLNLKDNLGVGNEAFPSIEAFGGLGDHHLSLTYTPISYSGSTTLSAPITFNGQVFAAGSRVETDLDLRMLDLEYRYTFLDVENFLAGFSLDAIGKIKYIDGKAKISAPGKEASDTVRLPLPMVGLGAHVGILLDILEARARVTGIGYSNNYLLEAVADLSWTPFPFLDIHGGYKVIRIRIDRKDLFLDSQFTGPYVALTVSY
jgi:hypothetical protein